MKTVTLTQEVWDTITTEVKHLLGTTLNYPFQRKSLETIHAALYTALPLDQLTTGCEDGIDAFTLQECLACCYHTDQDSGPVTADLIRVRMAELQLDNLKKG